jgi:crotonobetainyl-CoA:carnitine CoA-transferase CaiB-like acyl-CoA transferase
VGNRPALATALQALLATAPAQQWVDRLTRRGVPCGLVNGIDEAIAMAERLDLEPVVDMARADGTSSRQSRHPVNFTTTPASYRLAPPRWDELMAAADLPALLREWRERSS